MVSIISLSSSSVFVTHNLTTERKPYSMIYTNVLNNNVGYEQVIYSEASTNVYGNIC